MHPSPIFFFSSGLRRLRRLWLPLLLWAGLLTSPAADPAAPAPNPTRPAADVIALYTSSGTYTPAPVDTWRADWSVATLTDFVIPDTTRTLKRYSTLNYAGVEFFNPKVNATGKTRLHLDLWTPDATKFSVKLVSFGVTTAEREIFFTNTTIVQNQWVSLDIPLSQFAGVDLTNLAQLLFINNAGGVENGTFFIDNVYFYDDGSGPPPPPPAPATAAPVPTRTTVKSLYTSSGVYPAERVDTWRADWSQGNVADHTIAGTSLIVKKYSSLNYAGVEFFNPKVDATGMTTLHLDLWTPDATKFSVKLVSFNPGAAEKEIFFTNTTIVQNQWVSLDIPLNQFTGVDRAALGQLLFINNAGGVENGTFYIDNVYFYDDGTGPPPPPAVPTAAANFPTRPANKVKSLFNSSGTYTDVPVDTWRTSWSAGNLADYLIDGTTVPIKKYSSLNYAGVEFFNPYVDATGMTTLHVHLWTPDATKFSLKLVSFPGAAEKEVFFTNTTILQKQWVSLNIPLSQFTGVNLASLGQMLFINNAGGVENGTFYIDNVYFYDDGTAPPPPPAVPATAAPIPTRPAALVKSLYNSSATYTDVPVDTWSAPWSVATFAPWLIDGTASTVKKYSSLNYAGVEFFNPNVDATGMTTLHIDLWTPDATKFSVKLVSFPGAAEKEVFFTNTTILQKQWVSLDIPLSQFTGVNLASLGQLLFVNNAGGVENGTFYIDNVYFHRPAPPAGGNADLATGGIVSWTAASATATYQPQRSSDGSVWTNFGAAFTGNAVTSSFDPLNLPFHRVLATPAGGGAPTVVPATSQAGLQITWPSTPGTRYQVQAGTGLTAWSNFGAVITATGSTTSVMDPFTLPKRFYQVIPAP